MKRWTILFFVLCSFDIWSQKPEWLKIDPNGHSLFVQGLMNDRADTTLVLAGTVTLSPLDKPKESYTIKANSLGVFQFHLRENAQYLASFQFQGYVSRCVIFNTQDVPDKAWKKGCDLYLNMQMDQRPVGFKDMVAELPFATFKFDIDERIFLFDIEESNRAIDRYNEELERARSAGK